MEENMLKLKYNELLNRYAKGAEYVAEHSDDEKAQKELKKIEKELSKIIEALPDMTDEEKTNGFPIESVLDVEVVDEPIESTTYTQEMVEQNHKDDNLPEGIKPVPVEQAKEIIKNSTPQSNAISTFKDNWNIATQLAKSDIIPDNYKNKPQNIVIAIGIANQMQLDAFTVMQNMALIRGKMAWSGSFCRTLIERTGKFKDLELNYIGKKGEDSYGCYLSATRVSDGKIINGPEVTIAMAKAEKWTSNSKWNTLPDLMLAYRCQSYFCRLHCPEAMSGIYTAEEIEDINTTRQAPTDVLS